MVTEIHSDLFFVCNDLSFRIDINLNYPIYPTLSTFYLQQWPIHVHYPTIFPLVNYCNFYKYIENYFKFKIINFWYLE